MLGKKVKDIVTGFEGIATSRLEYLNGCVQYCVKPQAKKGATEVPDGSWIDSQQLVVVGSRPRALRVAAADTGGPVMNAPKNYR